MTDIVEVVVQLDGGTKVPDWRGNWLGTGVPNSRLFQSRFRVVNQASKISIREHFEEC